MEEKLIKLYCTICQCNDSRFIEGKQRLSNNNCPQFSDEELITVYLWGKTQQFVTRKASYNYTRNHLLEWFPKLPSYQAFCRRRNRLTAAFQALADIWTEAALAKEPVRQDLIHPLLNVLGLWIFPRCLTPDRAIFCV